MPKSDYTPPSDKPDIGDPSFYRPARLEYWSKMPFWTPVEAACVTLDLSPDPLIQADLDDLQSDPVIFQKLSDRARLAHKAVEVGHVDDGRMPVDWLRWLDTLSEPYPKALVGLVASAPRYEGGKLVFASGKRVEGILKNIQTIAPKGADTSDGENMSSITKQIDSLQKIVIAASIGGYGYDHNAKRSKTAKDIADDATRAGISIHMDTVRHHVRESAEKHLPNDWDVFD